MRVADFMMEVDHRSQGRDGRLETWSVLFTRGPDGSKRPIYLKKLTVKEWEDVAAAYLPVQRAAMDKFLADYRRETGSGESVDADARDLVQPPGDADAPSDSDPRLPTLSRS